MPYQLQATKELTLPGSEPRTVVVIAPMTEEDWAILEAAATREQAALRKLGRDPDDADALRKIKAMERDGIAGAISEIRNADDDGTTLTGRDEVAAWLAKVPMLLYRTIRAEVMGGSGLTDLEGKA